MATYPPKPENIEKGTTVYWGGNFHSGLQNLVRGIYLGNNDVMWIRADKTDYRQDMRNDWGKIFASPLEAMLHLISRGQG